MRTIYLAHHQDHDLDVVLKVPSQAVLDQPRVCGRIVTEAKLWPGLDVHPNIACCFCVLDFEDVPIVVAEFVNGGDLRGWIAEGKCSDPKLALDLAIQFCYALEHIHSKGLIHRCIRPENIRLNQQGTLKLTDAVIERAAGMPPGNGSPAAVSGVASLDSYIAPEHFAALNADIRDDIFALGVCLYEMLCGQPPYEMARLARYEPLDPAKLRRDVDLPKSLCQLMRRCVDRNRDVRPSNAVELASQLGAIYDEIPGELRLSLQSELTDTQELRPGEIEAFLHDRAAQREEPDPEFKAAEADVARETEFREESVAEQFTASQIESAVPEAIELQSMAEHCCFQGKLEEAELNYLQALAIIDRILGPQHPYASVSLKELADLYKLEGESAKAEPLYKRLLTIQEKIFGTNDPKVARTLSKLADVCLAQNKVSESAIFAQRCVEMRKVLPPNGRL